MNADQQRSLEEKIRAHAEEGRFREATDVAIRGYGSELFGFIMNTTHDEALAQDIFQNLCMEVWRALPRFEWKSNFRTWVYTLARRTTFHTLRAPDRRRGQRLHTEDELQLRADWARTSTMEWQKTENKDRFWLLCEALDPEQRSLVMLRIAQNLSWTQIARIMSEEDAPSPEALERATALYRKRFERTKTRLKEAMRKMS